ncbi:SNF2 family N-terminal domain-containing protein [Hyaloraphidium curvatum]|nr:SNF2 family N-terminal domain-containing protein [Hyaloraphidium curvatum]
MSVPLGWMRFNLSDAAAGAQVDWDLLKDLGLADRKGNDKPTAKTKSLPVSLAWHLPPAVRRTSQRVWELVVVRAPQTDGKPSAYQLLDTDSEALARCSVDRLEGHNVGQTLRARHEAGYVRLAGVLRTLDGDLVLDVGVVVTEKAFIYGDDKEDDGNLTLKMVPDGEHQMLVLAEEILHNDPFGSLAAGDEADAYYTSTPFRKSAKLENILAKEADPHKRWQLSRDKFNILESVLPPADSPQASQPAGLVPSTKLRPHQLKTLKWMVDMEDYDNHPDADVLHPAWLPLNVSNAKWAAGLHSDKAAVPMPEGETTLYIHEVTGTVTTKRFTAFRPERGGILADEMGLGKTLLVIALILSNPDCEDRKIDLDRLSDASYVPAVKTTLVVVPNEQLLDQWLGEFAKHAPQLRVKRHDKKITAIGKAWTIEHKKKYLQELATYDVVVAQFKNTDSAELCSVQFLRLVTDEAHEVRKESATTLRIQGIGSWSSWIVTGTPLVTGVADLLGYCTFLGLHPFMDGTVFNDCILQRFRKAGEGDDEGLERVRGLLSKIMRRYTKDDVKAELATPPMASENLMIELRARERWCYDRLRRALSEFLARAEAKANGATRLPRKPGMTVRNAVQDLKKHASLSVTAAGRPRIRIPEDDIFQTMTEANILENAVPYARSGRLTEVKKNGIEVPEKCDDCQTESDAMVVTFCCLNARNCAPCYVKCLKEQGEQKKCPLCRAPAGKDRAAILIHDEALEGLGSVHGNAPEEDDELVVRFGSKILGTVRDMASRFNADASAKAIVFSHFPEVLADMKDALELMGIQSVLYGSGHAAAVALQSIRHDGNVRVLLMPMRERVVAGLTLTCCNLVYLMEPPLAAAIAAQAANRVDRDGQTRQPITINVLAANTIDENVVAYRALVPPTESATSLNIRGWKMLIDGHGM